MIMIPDPLDEDFPLGDGVAETSAWRSCPYCGAEVELLLDAGGGAEQEYIEDCEVCCRPWVVRVRWVGEYADVELQTEDD